MDDSQYMSYIPYHFTNGYRTSNGRTQPRTATQCASACGIAEFAASSAIFVVARLQQSHAKQALKQELPDIITQLRQLKLEIVGQCDNGTVP